MVTPSTGYQRALPRSWTSRSSSLWMYENTLKVEHQATALSLYELSIEKKTGEIAEVKNLRRLETHFRSPQLDLWRLSDTEWLLALRRPAPISRKKPGKVVVLAEQLVLIGWKPARAFRA